ncbi:hypothetical protein QBC37DRAFT_393436 [Rhypophila decipiens]|uniref:Clr5 domain-containing protein n=1 Tax=Rhypophila decipiens TaxID=261697 RepID=A0AAN6XT66_9PEZI|nr:hypothetical protein QBC37DRAFT_393436 [Rhypophila decipiens]
MPRQKKGPTDEEWGLQKSRIKEIFDRKGNDGDKVTVAKLREIMKRGHSFDAPLWQYEAKLKEWNLKRNGRLEDWAVVISKVDQLGEGGMIVRVLMSGHAVEKKIINRNRRLVNKLKAAGKQLCPFDEFQNQADEWVSYTGDQCLEEVTRPLVAPRSGLATFDSRDIAPSLNVETNIDLKFDLSRVHPFMTNPSIAFTLLPTGAQVDLKGAAIIVQRFGRVDESVVREMLRQLRDIRCQPNGCAQASCGSQNLLWTILNCCEVTFAVASIRHLLENCCVGWAATLIESLIEAPEEAGPPLCNFATTTVLHILDGCERSRASVMSLSRLADVLAEFLRSLSGRDRALSYEFAMTAIDRFIEDCKTYGYPDGFPISILISLVHIPTDAALRANDPICNFAMSTVGRLVERYNSLEKPNYQIRSPEEALAECLCVAASRADVLVCKFLLNLIPVSHHALITAARANSNNPIIDLFLNDKSICEALQKAPSICCTCHNYWQSLRRPGDPSGCKISTRTALGDAVRRRDLDLVARLEKAGAWRLVQDNCKAFKDLFSAAIETVASDFLSRLLKIWNDRLPGWSHSQLDDILHIVYLSIEKDMTDIALSLLDTAIQRKDFRSFTWNGFGHSYKRGGILFHLALARRNERIVEVLLESDMGFLKPDLTLPTWCRFEGMQESALLLANRWKGHPFVQELIHLGCALYGALEQAVKAEELELVRFLLRWNWDPKELGTSFLHALMKHNKELVQLLMAAGADPANVDAFRFAIGAGCKISEGLSSMSADSKIFQILVDKDADWEALGILIHAFKTRYPNGRSGFGADALIIVLTGNDINLLRRLLQDARLDVNSYASNYSNYMKSNYSFSPLGFAIRHCREIGLELEQVEMLLQAGADINAVAEGLYLDNRKMDKPPETALQVVIRTRDLQMVEFLVHRGAKVNHPARRGLKMTPLQTACSIGSYPIAEFLLNQGAEVNAPPAYSAGATALQFAAISGSTRIVELLLQRGADIHAAPSKYNGRTALQGAAEHGRMHVLNILWERGNGRFPDEEIRMAQEFARKNRNPACAEHLDWLSEVSPAERRLQIGDLAHMAVPETETWEGEGLR